MGLLSSSLSITRYRVNGSVEKPILDVIREGLSTNAISDIDSGISVKRAGWTSFETPYIPDFSGSSFVYGPYFIFILRIDRKIMPSKVIQKHIALETGKILEKSGREYLSSHEKQMIKDRVINDLNLRIPATPNLYDLIWDTEASTVYFFSSLKGANEELETLFFKSFKVSLVRLFPYTTADLTLGLSDAQKDALTTLSPTQFAV